MIISPCRSYAVSARGWNALLHRLRGGSIDTNGVFHLRLSGMSAPLSDYLVCQGFPLSDYRVCQGFPLSPHPIAFLYLHTSHQTFLLPLCCDPLSLFLCSCSFPLPPASYQLFFSQCSFFVRLTKILPFLSPTLILLATPFPTYLPVSPPMFLLLSLPIPSSICAVHLSIVGTRPSPMVTSAYIFGTF